MKNVILLSLVNLLNYSFLISQVYVSGRIINAPENAHFSITFFNNTIEYFERTSATEILDKNGEFSAHFEWDKPGIATLSIANEYSDIFLSPEDSLFITADYNSFDSTLLYQGRGQENNNYLATQTQYYFNKRAYRHTKDQDPFQYLEYVDSIEKANIHLYNSFDKNLFTEDFNLYMKNYLKYRFVDPRWMFKVDFSKFDENGKPNYKDLPDDYYAFIWDIDLNDQEAYDNTFYSNAIERYIFEVMSRKDYVNDTSPDKNKFPFYVNRYHLIKSSFKGKVLDFQLTKFMNHYASFQHEDEYWEELMIDYKNTCHNQEYIDIIVNQYKRSTSLSYGKNAPNF